MPSLGDFLAKKDCFVMGGHVYAAARDATIAREDLKDGREYEHVTTHLRKVIGNINSLVTYAPTSRPALNQFSDYVDALIKMTLGADDTADDREALILHVDEILKTLQRMGEKMKSLCS